MCGIAGIVSLSGAPPESEAVLHRMAEHLRHRGPDANGFLRVQDDRFAAALAHTRLSIIDLSAAANQPMASPSGRSIVVFNGEIYNYAELRERLLVSGATFRTRSDTEVLLHGYEAWGIHHLVERLDGMFAFALVDRTERKVYLARDPFGKKPCYYWHQCSRERLVFSSDARSFAIAGAPGGLNRRALGYYFSELATPERESIWVGVEKLPGGHVLEFSASGTALTRSWTLDHRPDPNVGWTDAVDTAADLFRRAVKKRLVGDVPCAALLSGGVDSSLVVLEMARQSGSRLRTYTVGFQESPVDERPFARVVADRAETDHTEIVARATDIVALRSLLPEYGEPFADCSALPTYLIARKVAEAEKVVLTGDGGDELFAGYYIYYFANKLDLVRRLAPGAPLASLLARAWPTYRTRFLDRLLRSARQPLHRLLDRGYGFSPPQLRRLLPEPSCSATWNPLDEEHERVWRESCSRHGPTLYQVLAGCLHTRLSNDHLVKVDRATMYASLEARAPLLDKDLARFSATLPPDVLLHEGQPKAVLKALALRHLPRKFVMAEKRGFAVPIAAWLRDEMKQEFRETVLGGRQRMVPMDYSYVEELLAAHGRGQDHCHRLWAVYAFHVWAQAAVGA